MPHTIRQYAAIPGLGNEMLDQQAAQEEFSSLLSSSPEIEAVIRKAREGSLPLPRPLKDWEPNRLNDRHFMMIFLRAATVPHNRIAEITQCDESRVSVVLNHPWSQMILTKMMSHAAAQVIDMDARLKATAPEMHDIALQVARDPTEKGSVRARTALNLLEKAGYSTVQKVQASHEFKLPTKQAERMIEALEESRDISDLAYANSTEEPSQPDSAHRSNEVARQLPAATSSEELFDSLSPDPENGESSSSSEPKPSGGESGGEDSAGRPPASSSPYKFPEGPPKFGKQLDILEELELEEKTA